MMRLGIPAPSNRATKAARVKLKEILPRGGTTMKNFTRSLATAAVVVLVLVSLPCVAQEQPKPGLLGHPDCKVYFSASRLFRTMAGSVALHDFRVWGLSKSEVDRWVKKEHKKYHGLCYVLDPEHQDLTLLRLHFCGVYFTEECFFRS
jgi:hypothetical protein